MIKPEGQVWWQFKIYSGSLGETHYKGLNNSGTSGIRYGYHTFDTVHSNNYNTDHIMEKLKEAFEAKQQQGQSVADLTFENSGNTLTISSTSAFTYNK